MLNQDKKYNLAIKFQNILYSNKWMLFLTSFIAITFIIYNLGIFTKPTITVVGRSVEQVSNQLANFSLYVNTKNALREIAVEESTNKSNQIVDNLKRYGIEEKDIKVANLNIFRDQNYIDDKYVDGDWNASISIEIIVRDSSRVNSLTELISGLDVDSFYGPNFYSDPVTLNDSDLLLSALADANRKAKTIADSLNLSVNKVLDVYETEFSNYSTEPYRSSTMEFSGYGGGAEFLPGSSNVYKTVTVTYQLK